MVYDVTDPELIETLRYLLVSREERARTSTQQYDGKKNCWIPEPKEGYIAAEIQSTEGDRVIVETMTKEPREVKKEDIEQMNPPKYEKCEDMADMTYLNDATVLHNLRTRYLSWLIYVTKKCDSRI